MPSGSLRRDGQGRPVVVERRELDDGFTGTAHASRAVFFECGFEIIVGLGDDKISVK